MRGLLRLLARSPSNRTAAASSSSSYTCGHHRLYYPPSPPPSITPGAGGGLPSEHFLRSWQSRRSPADFSGLLGLLPSGAARWMVVSRGARFAACSRTLVDRGFHWMAFSLQRRQGGSRLHDYYRLRNFWTSWMPTSDGVLYGLLGVNVAVFVLWRIANPRFMMQNFTISLDNFKSGRLHTLITSAFSHMDGDHIMINMIGLYFFGTNIVRLFGPDFLLKLYIAGAISGSIFYLLHQALVVPSKGTSMVYHSRAYALGASAAVNAILLLDVFLFPKKIIYLNFFIPVPAALMGAIIIGSDLWRIKRGDEQVSGSAHLGGALVAALVWARIKHWI